MIDNEKGETRRGRCCVDHGDYIAYKVNWDTNEIQVCATSPLLSALREMHTSHTYPITPIVRALHLMAGLNPPPNDPPYHFLADMLYDRESLTIRVHRTEDYASVVDVPQERLLKVLQPLLTPRETEIAVLLFEGRTIRCIAATLHIAEGTVKRIIYNLYQKLGVASQVELVRQIYTRLAQVDWSSYPG